MPVPVNAGYSKLCTPVFVCIGSSRTSVCPNPRGDSKCSLLLLKCWRQYNDADHFCVRPQWARLLQRSFQWSANVDYLPTSTCAKCCSSTNSRSALRWRNNTGCLSPIKYNTSYHWWCSSALTTWVTLCHSSMMIPDVGNSVQLPVLITTFRTLEPNSETGRSRSPVQKRGTTYHNQSAQLTV